MITGPIIAEIAALIGDPARATMLSALIDGRALTASELAVAARITPQTASTHLAKLTGAGVLTAVRNGRHRYFRLASPTVGDMIDGIVAVALLKRPRHRPLSRQARALSAARICYDHLAGRLSVSLTDSLVARECIALGDDVAEITAAGRRFFSEFGLERPVARPARRHFSRLCLDWTERRPHIAGEVGAGLTRRYFDLGWVERVNQSQAVLVTPRGRQGFLDMFGIDTSEPRDRILR
jgi:DNA-binding transcriptional ArsR family regulator